MEPQVFQYHDPIEFLSASLASMQTRNPSYSMRSWAKQLGLSHVAMLSMVLSRKRKLLPSLSSKISTQFRENGKFNETETRYFDMLVLFHNATTQDEKNFYEGILSNLKPDRRFSTLDLDKLNVIADWYHSAILEMVNLKNFKPDPRWISLRLGDGVNETQVKAALDRLERLGLFERNEKGELLRQDTVLTTPTDIPNKSLRKHNGEMISKAVTALESQSVEQRDITSFTIATELKKIPEAKKMIREFRKKLGRFLESKNADTVYQLNVQLFDLLDQKEERK